MHRKKAVALAVVVDAYEFGTIRERESRANLNTFLFARGARMVDDGLSVLSRSSCEFVTIILEFCKIGDRRAHNGTTAA